jgi:hypothetical protein
MTTAGRAMVDLRVISIVARVAGGAAWLVVATTGISTLAQEPPLQVPAPLSAPTEAIPPAMALGTTLADGQYWLVSTRRCRQENDNRPMGCGFDYFLRDGSGRIHRSHNAAFEQSFRPGVPICVVVHGSFVTWDGLISDSAPLYRWIRSAAPERPLHVVFLSWPSDGPLTFVLPLDIAVLGQRSAANGFYLARLVSQLPEQSPVSFVGHSHGARLITSALHILGGGAVEEYRAVAPIAASKHRIRAVLFAAAMDHDWLDPGERYGRMLYRADAVLNLLNREDMPLGFYPLRKFNSQPALARVGLTNEDRRRLGALNQKLFEIDVTPMIRSGHLWQHYFNQPAIASAISPFVFYTDQDPEPVQPQFTAQHVQPQELQPVPETVNFGWVPVAPETMPVWPAADVK